MALGEYHCHEVVVLLCSVVIGILTALLLAYESGCSRPVVTVGNVECRNGREYLGDPLDILVIVDYPEMMSETVVRSHEVVLGLAVGVLLHDGVDLGVVRISEEYGLDVGVLDVAGELVLLDLAGEVVVHIGAEHDSVLGTAVHRLGVNIVALLLVLYQPAFLLPFLEVLYSLVVCLLRVLVDDGVEVNLGLGRR